MIIKKDNIKGKNEYLYRAEIEISDGSYNVLIFLKADRRDILVRKQIYFNYPITKDMLIKNIKSQIKLYEEAALKCPNLDDWDGEIY